MSWLGIAGRVWGQEATPEGMATVRAPPENVAAYVLEGGESGQEGRGERGEGPCPLLCFPLLASCSLSSPSKGGDEGGSLVAVMLQAALPWSPAPRAQSLLVSLACSLTPMTGGPISQSCSLICPPPQGHEVVTGLQATVPIGPHCPPSEGE